MSVLNTQTILIPEEVKLDLEKKTVKVTGEKGHLIRDFSHANILIYLEGEKINISAVSSRRKNSALVGTIFSHINNMITGVTKGWTYKLKIVYSHFPISLKIEGKKIIIENFIGERNPRIAKIVGETSILKKEDDVIVQGINLDDVSQTAANIEQATKVKKKDPRKFLDGIYIYEKKEGKTD
jgi:large subunit ribosomal protein L6